MKHINQIVILLSLFISCLSHAMVPPLHVAVCNGNLEQARALLDAKEDVNAVSEGLTPLHKAVSNKGEAIVGLLIERGANVNAAAESDSWTPLHLAAYHGYESIAHLLLRADANPDAGTRYGWKPLELAEKCDNRAVATLLRNWPLKNQREELSEEEVEKGRNILLSWRSKETEEFFEENPEEHRPSQQEQETAQHEIQSNRTWVNNILFQSGAVATGIAGLSILGYQLLKRR